MEKLNAALLTLLVSMLISLPLIYGTNVEVAGAHFSALLLGVFLSFKHRGSTDDFKA